MRAQGRGVETEGDKDIWVTQLQTSVLADLCISCRGSDDTFSSLCWPCLLHLSWGLDQPPFCNFSEMSEVSWGSLYLATQFSFFTNAAWPDIQTRTQEAKLRPHLSVVSFQADRFLPLTSHLLSFSILLPQAGPVHRGLSPGAQAPRNLPHPTMAIYQQSSYLTQAVHTLSPLGSSCHISWELFLGSLTKIGSKPPLGAALSPQHSILARSWLSGWTWELHQGHNRP